MFSKTVGIYVLFCLEKQLTNCHTLSTSLLLPLADRFQVTVFDLFPCVVLTAPHTPLQALHRD